MGLAATAIELDNDEVRRELVQRAGSLTLPYRVVVRAKLVLLAADGHTNREIAARVDMSADRVADWRKRFAAEGIEGLEDRARSGRPCRFPPQEVAQVKAVACELPKTLGRPQSRFSRSEIHRFVVEQAVNNFASTAELARALNDFERYYNEIAEPFDWTFTRDDLAGLLTRLDERERESPLALAA